MANEETKSGSYGSGGCGGGGCGCPKKMIAAVFLLLIGGVIGYLCGKCCSVKSAMCPMTMAPAAVSTPAK